jgi:hypothetical protein
MLRRVALVRTDVSEELSASIIRVTIGELGTTLTVTSNRRTVRRNTGYILHSHCRENLKSYIPENNLQVFAMCCMWRITLARVESMCSNWTPRPMRCALLQRTCLQNTLGDLPPLFRINKSSIMLRQKYSERILGIDLEKPFTRLIQLFPLRKRTTTELMLESGLTLMTN